MRKTDYRNRDEETIRTEIEGKSSFIYPDVWEGLHNGYGRKTVKITFPGNMSVKNVVTTLTDIVYDLNSLEVVLGERNGIPKVPHDNFKYTNGPVNEIIITGRALIKNLSDLSKRFILDINTEV